MNEIIKFILLAALLYIVLNFTTCSKIKKQNHQNHQNQTNQTNQANQANKENFINSGRGGSDNPTLFETC